MNQLAWLDFYRGQWHLATSASGNPVRKWTDREAALSDLTSEGWTSIEPFSRQAPKTDAKRTFRRVTLARTIH